MAESPIIEQLRRHIHDYVEGHECYGTNGHDQRRPFVPQAALTAFWTREKIIGVLCHDGLIPRNPDIILDYYIAIFTIVVLTSEPANIDLFMQEDLSDSSLPLGSVPEAYRESLVHHGVFEDFMKLQWKFCPMSLDVSSRPKPSRKNMSPEIILPISNKIKINPQADEGKDIAILYKVDLHRNCTQLTVPVVFKEYRQADSESQRLHDNEWAMYSNLRDGSFRHIVTYYGSFGCMGRRTIVLEYAPGGTLLQFFKERQPPKTDCHRVQFWQNLFGLLGGLEAIDDFTWDHNHSKDTWRLRGTHQDIRLQNILVCGTSSDDDYSVPFKFADMGNAHIRKTKNEGIDRRAVDQYGNGMYSAPEAFRDNGDPINIDHKSDVWSLGAILSEALIWSIWGERGREIYQDERIQRTRQTKLKGGHHEGAFHDGDRLLDVVENWHERVISKENSCRRLRGVDHNDSHLGNRIAPSEVHATAPNRLANAPAFIRKSVAKKANRSKEFRKSPATNSHTQAIGRTLGLNSSDEDPLKVFPELKIPLTRLRGEGGRNQIFVLDDSNSMESSREQLGRTLRVLSKLLKKGQVDPDKEFELYFASTGECKKARHSTDLQSFISTHSFSNPRCEMHAILDQVATKVIKEDQMVSIYVLTNGHWNPQDYKSLCGVDKPIERLVRHIVNGNKQDNWAIVQFIGFHSSSHNDADQCGKARMRYLDNDLNLER
ncbi:Serine/threonine-protein kinase [Colletotrichum fructicola]|nr:Serine/threonine-protein kinase [Colletotrichum fructicola]KAF4934639.1 Serine/threonine-protein kinase [Colletotrichum fructicola]